ncbi:MAG TPA: hypothetical protein VE978_28420 [Chitinophagales bacterium]|nr:hypothetical protein [Chitinophagales bacterium]
MKKQFLVSGLFALCFAITSCSSEHYVATQPAPPAVVVAPPPPGRIWVDYDYRWRGGKYVVVPRRAIKVRPGRTWVPGHWMQKPKGSIWIPGHWK